MNPKGSCMNIAVLMLDAGHVLKSFYGEVPKFREKARYELVTEADHEVERLLVTRLRAAFGDDTIFSEESGASDGTSTTRWILDPIDGTAYFIAGVPYFAISLAREVDGSIVEGYVYNPISEEFYAAAPSAPACLNDEPIRVSACREIGDALIAFGFSARLANIQRYHVEWTTLFDGCRKGLPLIVPSLTLCNVARGRMDAFIDFGCSTEGQAAASLILKQAGGALYNYDLSEYDHRTQGIVACTPGLTEALRRPIG
jgi:myo-inositol-1(or 4)-monophosphatase